MAWNLDLGWGPHSHPTSVAALWFLLMCAPGARSLLLRIQRRSTGPPCRGTSETKNTAARPRSPSQGYPSVAGREKEIANPGTDCAIHFCLEYPQGLRGRRGGRATEGLEPGADQPREDEGRGESHCRPGKRQVPRSRGLQQELTQEHHDGAHRGLQDRYPGEGVLNFLLRAIGAPEH